MPRPTWPVVPVPVQGLGHGAQLDQEVAGGGFRGEAFTATIWAHSSTRTGVDQAFAFASRRGKNGKNRPRFFANRTQFSRAKNLVSRAKNLVFSHEKPSFLKSRTAGKRLAFCGSEHAPRRTLPDGSRP
jgi:hypothetical protein